MPIKRVRNRESAGGRKRHPGKVGSRSQGSIGRPPRRGETTRRGRKTGRSGPKALRAHRPSPRAKKTATRRR
jgi:hypothetical protein